jgi:hypothetical protein
MSSEIRSSDHSPLYEATALLINVIMQVTAFIELLALDNARKKTVRYDVLCCVKSKHMETKKSTGFFGVAFARSAY